MQGRLSFIEEEIHRPAFFSHCVLDINENVDFSFKYRVKEVVFSELDLIDKIVCISNPTRTFFNHVGISWPEYLKACHSKLNQSFQKFYQKSKFQA